MSEITEDFIHNKYGYCYYEIESGKNPIIFNLFVNPQYRRQGHARWLLEYVINIIRGTGYIGKIDIEVAPREDSIQREQLAEFYISMGLNILDPEGGAK
jgi:GNAT superfamily N-acetyltransferase